jgi:hypothetical protein
MRSSSSSAVDLGAVLLVPTLTTRENRQGHVFRMSKLGFTLKGILNLLGFQAHEVL